MRKYSQGWASTAEWSRTDGLMNDGNESEGKECIILGNDSFRKCAEDSGI